MTLRALITGGQQGIGLGIARALADAGFHLTLAAEQPETASVAREGLAQLPEGTRYIRHDLADIAAIPALLEEVEAEGPLTTLISNAGVPATQRGDLLEMTPESFDRCHDINLRGTFFLAQAVARRMVARQSPHYRSLIFVTSVSAEMASPDRAEYCISKAGAAMMARNFALRLAPLNIGVFELRPGIIATPMTAGVRDRYDTRIAEGLVPANRWGQPADVGAAVLPLVTGQMAFATGAAIPLDGGLSIPRL
ncbi:3-ketoacyl-ACP reductase [Tabrizicola fusiformis]|uniref:3-ketoacyl-ACP reductase n=1 Tax=Tabrizicola sp. SY72 TaxID=2741673 RepID=UPI001571795D|nr:3-ketoacyl-ACP reductase [Tabrizicola sp. SY72]NTT86535.1 3-ketoacyl-ACP reductase [Tabrizicola sp. SY72]